MYSHGKYECLVCCLVILIEIVSMLRTITNVQVARDRNTQNDAALHEKVVAATQLYILCVSVKRVSFLRKSPRS